MKITTTKQNLLQKEIDRVLSKMEEQEPMTEEYRAMAENLERLQRANTHVDTLSKDTMMVVAGNLLGIGLILNYEKLGHITSKAIGFVIRGRV